MDFLSKYELLDLLSERDGKTYRARQLSSGRLVAIHRFDGPLAQADVMKLILAYLRTVASDRPSQILDMDEQQGSLYLATDPLPEGQTLSTWIVEETRKRETPARQPPMPRPAPAQAVSTQPGSAESTMILKARPIVDRRKTPRPVVPPAAPSWVQAGPSTGQPGGPPPAPEPGEFTRIFGLPSHETPPPVAAPPTTPPLVGSATSPGQPSGGATAGQGPSSGEFTMIFGGMKAPASPPPTMASAPGGEEPAPVVRTSARPEAGSGAGPSSPGEAGTPLAPERVELSDAQPGEFTRIFQPDALKTPASAPPKTVELAAIAGRTEHPTPPPAPVTPACEARSMAPAPVQFTSPRDLETPPDIQAGPDADATAPLMQARSSPEPRPFLSDWAGRTATEPGPQPGQEPGEFTRIFQGAPVVQPHVREWEAASNVSGPTSPSGAATPVTPRLPTRGSPEEGEFTRIFRAAPTVPTARAQRPARPPVDIPSPQTPSEAQGPGEFTRIFHSVPAGGPAGPPPPGILKPTAPARLPAASPEQSQPGEFTRVFRSGGITAGSDNEPYQSMTPSSPAIGSAGPGQPGEFTRIFGTPGFSEAAPEGGVSFSGGQQTPPAYPAASPPGSPLAAPPRPGTPKSVYRDPSAASTGGSGQVGEFTRIFGSSPAPQAPASPAAGGATQFSRGVPVQQPAAPAPHLEAPAPPYSFGGSAAPAAPATSQAIRPTAAMPPVAQPPAYPVFSPATPAKPPIQAPMVQPAPVPPMPTPPVSAPKKGSSVVPLIVILGSLLVAAVFLILYFAMKH